MLTSMSSLAILSKTRAMFGRRLKISDYTSLASAGGVEQAAAYLKKSPAYADVLEGVNERTIHRRELEDLIRQKHYMNFESLCRYELSIGERLAEYILLTSEIKIIVASLSRIMAGIEGGRYVLTASRYLDRHLKIDLRALERAKNFGDILEAVKESEFYKALNGFRARDLKEVELAELENALFTKYNGYLIDLFQNSLDDGAKEVLLDMFKTKIDLTNIAHIVRLKKYFNDSGEHRKFAVISGGNASVKFIEKALDCKDADEVLALAKNNRLLSKKLRILDRCYYIDEAPERYLFEKSFKEIYFSPYPAVVMVSYLNISSVEIDNIVKIIEGIRYKLSPDEIMGLLILQDKSDE